MTVQRVLNAQPKRTTTHIVPDATIADLLESSEFEDIGALVVSSDGKMVEGIISERDIVRGVRSMGTDLLGRRIRDLMTAKVLTCAPDDRAVGIMALMIARHVEHLPVVTAGTLVGIVSVRDLLHLRVVEVQSEAEAMRKYISGNV